MFPRCSTAGERDGSGSAFAPRIQGRSTGSDCKCPCCPPKYCPGDSSLRTSDIGNPNTHYLCLSRSSRTTGPRKPEPAVNQQSRQQEQRRQPESHESSSASMLDAITTPGLRSVFAADIRQCCRSLHQRGAPGGFSSCLFFAGQEDKNLFAPIWSEVEPPIRIPNKPGCRCRAAKPAVGSASNAQTHRKPSGLFRPTGLDP
jgi:hypothetical protein